MLNLHENCKNMQQRLLKRKPIISSSYDLITLLVDILSSKEKYLDSNIQSNMITKCHFINGFKSFLKLS